MLTVLTLGEPLPPEPKKTWRTRRLKAVCPGVSMQTVRIPEGSYRHITVRPKNGQIDWYTVWRCAGGEAVRLLMPPGIIPPPGCGVFPFVGRELTFAWMRSFLIHKMSQDIGMAWTVGIYDPAGVCPMLPIELLPYAADIRIVTDSDQYDSIVDHAFRNYGAAIQISGDRRMLRDVMWLAAPDGLAGLAMRGEWGSVSGVPDTGTDIVDAFLPNRADRWLSMTPPTIVPERFLAGLYECSNLRCLSASPPAFVRFNGRFKPM